MAEWLRNEILSGRLAAGTQLQQGDVARRLAVSPTPVREAFQLLVAEGMLRSRPHHAVIVDELNLDDMTAIYELRATVEGAALRRAVERIEPEALAALRSLIRVAEKSVRTGDLSHARSLNAEFHHRLVVAAGTRVYADAAAALISRSRFLLPLDKHRMREILDHHRRILDLVEARDVAGALREFDAHMQANLRDILAARSEVRPSASEARS